VDLDLGNLEIRAQPRPAEWPQELLDVAALERTGWQPEPFRQFVLKIHSRCNLACEYCYVYEMADQTWRARPLLMSRETLAAAGRRIAEHARVHGLPSVRVILHGGEPLLAGAEWLTDATTSLRAAMPEGVTMRVTLQTNGVLVSTELLEQLWAHDVDVGVSLDGPAHAHDRRRRFSGGRASYPAVARALRLLASPRYRPMFAGLLCVVDLDNDPVEVLDELLSHGPPTIDLLLPHGTWSDPPPGRSKTGGGTPYADWLAVAFDHWYAAPSRHTDVRFFSEIINLLLGGHSGTEATGLTPASVIVIETDGAIEQVDALKAAYHGAAATGLSVHEHSLDLALRHPSIAARQIGTAALAGQCLRCEVRDVCGGGYYPHRYRAGTGFRNPSVYCPDLLALIHHIAGRVRADLASLNVAQ
jgi:uncharacterized protein